MNMEEHQCLRCRLGIDRPAIHLPSEFPFLLVLHPRQAGVVFLVSSSGAFLFIFPHFSRGLVSVALILWRTFTLQSFLIPPEVKLANSLPMWSQVFLLCYLHLASVFHLPMKLNLIKSLITLASGSLPQFSFISLFPQLSVFRVYHPGNTFCAESYPWALYWWGHVGGVNFTPHTTCKVLSPEQVLRKYSRTNKCLN